MKNDYNFNPHSFKGLSEQSEAVQKTIAKIISSIPELEKCRLSFLNGLSPLIKQQEEIVKVLFPAMQEISERTIEMMKPWQSAINAYMENLRTVSEKSVGLWQRLAQQEKKLRKKLKDDNVFLIPYFGELPFDAIDNLFLQHESKKPIEIYHEIFLDERNVNDLLSHWAKYPHFKKRYSILGKALKAHLSKDYELSIPVLITQFEGILCEIIGVDRYTKGKSSNKLKQVNWFKEDKEIFQEIVDMTVFKSLSKKTPRFEQEFSNLNYANRHLILHGQDISYYKNPLNSTRFILLLDFLTLFLRSNGKSE